MISATAKRAAGPGALVVLSAVATFSNAPGSVIADARYEHIANPIRFLSRHGSLWDDSRSLGQPTQFFSPVLGALQALWQLLGAQPWVIERLTHTLLLGLAGSGAYALSRSIAGTRGTPTLVGFVYAFNPFTTQFLLPSGLFAAYAAAPWLTLAAWRGAERGADHWRWAAAFAVPVFAMGILNTSALLLAMVPAAAVFFSRWASPMGGSRSAWAWLWRTAILTGGATSAMAVVQVNTNDVVRFNLETTETVRTVAANSSASESWRGMGQWLSYLRLGGGSIRDQSAAYFTDPLVIVATFGLVIIAAAALLSRRDQIVGTLGAVAAVGVVLMVGIHPANGSSPLGSILAEGFDKSLAVRGFRSTYKAGTSLQLALALLIGITWHRLLSKRTWIRLGCAGAILSVVLVAGFPFWTGNLYPTADRYDNVPEYWEEAFDWFADQPANSGVLILPSAARTRYRWGYVNDTLFDANLTQPAVAAGTLPRTTPVLAALTEEIDNYLASSASRPGALAPMLQRAGVRWVLLQNDVDWAAMGVSRPFAYEQVRLDPAFSLVASFGVPGTNTTEGPALDNSTRVEAGLSPVEVYQVLGPEAPFATVYSETVVVSGAPDAWPTLAREGWLTRPVVLDGSLGTERAEVIGNADALVATDGGQRRAVRVSAGRSLASPVLGEAQTLSRPVQNVFDNPDQQTVATYGDLLAVSATSSGTRFDPWLAPWWPNSATDRDPATAWATSAGGRQVLELAMLAPTDVGVVRVTPYVGRRLLRSAIDSIEILALHVDGSTTSLALELGPGQLEVRIPSGAQPIVELRIAVTSVGGAGLVGIADVEIETTNGVILDGRRRLRLPGPTDPVAEATWLADIADTPVHQLFTRLAGGEERLIRREFWRPGGAVGIGAVVRIDDSTPADVIDALVGSEVGAIAPTKLGGGVRTSARAAIDSSMATAWEPDPANPGPLSLRVPESSVDELELSFVVAGPEGAPRSRATSLTVEVFGTNTEVTETAFVKMDDQPTCDAVSSTFSQGVCIERIVVPLNATPGKKVVVTIDTVDVRQGLFNSAPLQLAEVQLRARGVDLVTPQSTSGNDGCRPLLRLDGLTIDMRPSPGSKFDLVSLQQGVRMTSCAFITLDTGWHFLDVASPGYNAIESVSVAPPSTSAPVSPPTQVRVLARSSTSIRLAATVEAGDVLVTRIADHDGWTLEASGLQGTRLSVDGFVAWQASEQGDVTVRLKFGPQRTYRLAWYVSAISVAVGLWLLIPGRATVESANRARIVPFSRPTERLAGHWAAALRVVGFGAMGWFVAGNVGLTTGIAVGVGLVIAPGSLRVAAVIGPIVLAIATIFEGSLDDASIGSFARTRDLSHDLGLSLTIIWLGAAFDIWSHSNPHRTVAPMSYGRRSPGVLGVLIALAIATVTLGIE